MADRAGRFGVRFIVTAAIVAVALAILLSLGTWQVERLHWKEGLLADIAGRSTAEPVGPDAVAAMVARGEPVDYRAMMASGRFLHAGERHFFATHQGRTGFYVYTPLSLEDGRYLLVNRGFVPYENKEPSTRVSGQIGGEVTVTGLAREKLSAKPSFMVPDNEPAKNMFYWKDLDAMAGTVGLPAEKVLPFFLDADATPVPGGMPQGGVTAMDLPNSHLQYAVTWYGLAATLAVIALVGFFRRQR